MAPVAWHVYLLSPLYNAEAVAKWHLYPPPDNGSYAYPWLWVDGFQRGWEYQYWRAAVESALANPASVEINLAGAYDPDSRQGRVRVEFVNSGPESIAARALVAVTEDSIFYQGTNGDQWHNHVLRDYIPDQNGAGVTVPGSGRDTLEQGFALEGDWNAERCNIVVYLQDPMVQPDSSMPVFQGARSPVLRLSGQADERPRPEPERPISIGPNPCRGILRIAAAPAPSLEPGRVIVQDAAGRGVKEVATGAGASVSADLRSLPGGVYFVSWGAHGTPPRSRVKLVLSR